MDISFLYYLLAFSGVLAVLHYVSGIYATAGDARRTKEERNTFERIAMLLTVLPVVTVIAFGVLQLGGGSRIAQYNSSLSLWSMWCKVWFPAFLLTPFIFIAQLCALCMRRPTHHEVSVHVCLATGAGLAAIAWLIAWVYYPDA